MTVLKRPRVPRPVAGSVLRVDGAECVQNGGDWPGHHAARHPEHQVIAGFLRDIQTTGALISSALDTPDPASPDRPRRCTGPPQRKRPTPRERHIKTHQQASKPQCLVFALVLSRSARAARVRSCLRIITRSPQASRYRRARPRTRPIGGIHITADRCVCSASAASML